MKKENKLHYSYVESKYSKKDVNEINQNITIKRSGKRHKTEMGLIPKNFVFLINASKLKKEKEKEEEKKKEKEKEKEKEIKDKKYNENTINISGSNHNFGLKKNKSTLILHNNSKYNLNNTIDLSNDENNSNKKKLKINPNAIPIKKSKSQLIDKTNISKFRRYSGFPKYERRMTDKFMQDKPKPEEPKQKEKPKVIHLPKTDNKGNTISISSPRRRSIGAGIRHYNKKESKIKKEISTITYVKVSKATSEAGLEDGNKKINQDAYIHEKNINGILNFNIFGVLDGHGDFGHLASNFVKQYILNRIKNHPMIRHLDNSKEIYNKLIHNGYQIITNIFLDADVQINKEKFNCEMSGTTCVLVIQLDENIICANTGDSRAIIVYDESPNNNLKNTKVFPLSYDAKPDNPGEKERIIECGGEVEKMIDEGDIGVGPFRVWIKGKHYPGLAMSRSIGDMDAKSVGVIPNPQIIEYKINSNTKYLIMASDGIWEFLSNEEVMQIANGFYLRNDALGLCQTLTNKSIKFWLKDDDFVDDITVVSVFF